MKKISHPTKEANLSESLLAKTVCQKGQKKNVTIAFSAAPQNILGGFAEKETTRETAASCTRGETCSWIFIPEFM